MRARRAVGASLLVVTSALVGCGGKHETMVIPATPTRVQVAVDGPTDPGLAPLYAGIAGGDFTRGGLAVSVLKPPSTALASLGSGAADLAVASEPDLLRARDQGARLVAIAGLVQGPLDAILSIAPHPITEVTQLDGKTIAAPPTPLAAAELDTVLRQAGVDPASVHRIGGDPARALITRAAVASLGSYTTDAARLRLAKRQPTLVKVAAAGVPTYNGLVLVARVDEAHNRGPILRTFLQALTAGDRATLAAPTSAADQLGAANPSSSRRLVRAGLKATIPALDPTPTGSTYGFADPRVWRTFGRWMLAQGLLTRPDDAALAVTDEFLPGLGE